jgi:hypothetical protein
VHSLNEREAFAAMTLFLNRFAERAGDDLLTLLGDITLRPGGDTFDPAAWDDWMDCVRDIANASKVVVEGLELSDGGERPLAEDE